MLIFFLEWVQLWEEKIMFNYMHMCQSGHVSETILHWKKLCKHSQQDWESLNGAIRSFFRRTNRGGHAGKNLRKIKLIAIARWLQSRLIFMCGYDEKKC